MALLTRLDYPFPEAVVRALKVGQRVSVSGRVFTARDRVHKFLADGNPSPVDLREGAIYHCGPVILRREGAMTVQAAGPTTSMREEPYMPGIIARHGIRLIIGKGGMGEDTLKACREFGCAYLQLTGGAACIVAGCVSAVEGVHGLDKFGAAEAMWVLNVRNLECVVTMDTHGRSLHRRVRESSRRVLQRFLAPRPAEGGKAGATP